MKEWIKVDSKGSGFVSARTAGQSRAQHSLSAAKSDESSVEE